MRRLLAALGVFLLLLGSAPPAMADRWFAPAPVLGVVLSGFLLDYPATWWVGGNLALSPIVLIGGIFVVRKLRRLDLVATFAFVNLAAVLATTVPSEYGTALYQALFSSPLLFLKQDWSLSMTSCPEIWTVFDPSLASDDMPVFG